MRKISFVAVLSAALAAAGIAVARGVDGPQGAKAVSATFTATTAGTTDTHTCKNPAGRTIATARATYTGTAASTSPELAGPASVDVRSTIDTAAGVGVVSGTLRIASSSGKSEAHFSAVYDHGAIAGTASGHAGAHTQLVANISAGFSAAGGLTNGKLGGGTAGGSAVEVSGSGCGSPHEGNRGNGSSAEGAITAVNASSITVGSLTCSVPASMAIKLVSNYGVGDRVKITCSTVSGTKTLVSIEKKR